MIRSIWMVFGFAAVLSVTVPLEAEAQYQSGPFKVVASGQRIRLAYFYSVEPNCSSKGPVEVELLRNPAHGEAGIGSGRDYPNFATTNTHSSCNNRKVSASYLYYTSEPGFVGVDTIVVTAVFPGGNARNYAYVVKVE